MRFKLCFMHSVDHNEIFDQHPCFDVGCYPCICTYQILSKYLKGNVAVEYTRFPIYVHSRENLKIRTIGEQKFLYTTP